MRNWFVPTLRTRLLLLVLLAALPALGFTLYITTEHRELAATAQRTELRRLARLAANRHWAVVKEAQALLETLTDLPAVRGPDATRCGARLREARARWPRYANVTVADANGDIWCSAAPLDQPVNVADRSYFQRVVETRGFAVGEYSVSRITKRSQLVLAHAVLGRKGQIEGVLAAGLALDWLDRFTAEADLPPGTTITLVDSTGTVLARDPHSEQWIGQSLKDPSGLIPLDPGQLVGTFEAVDLDGTQRLFGFAVLRAEPSPAGGVYAVIGFPRKLLTAEGDRILRRNLVVLLLATVLALAVGWVGSGPLILRRLSALMTVVRRAGAGDLAARTRVAGPGDELDELARAFDQMGESLQARDEALRASAARYEGLFHGLPTGLYRTTPDGRILDANPAMMQMLGYPDRDSLLGLNAGDLYVNREDRERWVTLIEREGVVHGIEVLLRRRDGSHFWQRIHTRAVRDDEGRLVACEGAAEDITERKRLEAIATALTEVGVELAGSLEVGQASQRVVSAVLQLFGVDHAALYRRDPASMALTCVAAAGGRLEQWVGQVLPPGTGLSALAIRDRQPVASPDMATDLRLALPDWLRAEIEGAGPRAAAATPLIARGEVLGTLTLSVAGERDFTRQELRLLGAFGAQAASALHTAQLFEEAARAYRELTQTQAQLLHAQKIEAIGELAGGVAHDFNNLLTVILGRAEFLLHKMGSEDPQRRHVELIQKTASRAAGLTQQLLAFSRRQTLQPRPLDMNAVVGDLVPMLRRLIGEDIDLLVSPSGDLARVRADPSRLEQVIVNLAVNARDAMPRGGRLTIETARVELDAAFAARHAGAVPGRYVRLAVTDTGVGMDAATQARIFEPFFTTKEPGKGTGLGLSTVYGIVKQHEGYITVESEPRRGTAFRIYLPWAEAEDVLERHEVVIESLRGSERILLVEDDEGVRDLVQEILRSYGYGVLAARDGAEALEIVEQRAEDIDLVVTDVVMPKMSGPELVERLAAIRPGLRVLYVSGYTAETTAQRGLAGSRHMLVDKPFTAEGVARKVREALDAT